MKGGYLRLNLPSVALGAPPWLILFDGEVTGIFSSPELAIESLPGYRIGHDYTQVGCHVYWRLHGPEEAAPATPQPGGPSDDGPVPKGWTAPEPEEAPQQVRLPWPWNSAHAIG